MRVEMVTLDREKTHRLFGSAVAPRPIALISTIGEDGIYNAAPFSAITSVCHKPPIICISIGLRKGQKKDTVRNIEFSGDFVINFMDETLIKPTIQASTNYPSDVDEIKETGLTAITADMVKSPRIAEAQVSLECRLVQRLELGEGINLRNVFFGEVVLAHIKDELMVDGEIESSRMRTVGRIGSDLYCQTRNIFEMKIK
jgi:flavin reductase (DIM6/NTAB) family NADH-FMN oxidoreductase RutF